MALRSPEKSPSSRCRLQKSEPQRQRQQPQQTDPNEPTQDGLLHQPTPLNLLALRDLYTQVPEQTSSLRRFGSDAFLHRGLNSSEMVTDLPVGPDYVLGPEIPWS